MWLATQDWIIERLVNAGAGEAISSLPADRLGLKIAEIRNLAESGASGSTADSATRDAALHLARLGALSRIAMVGAIAIVAGGGLFFPIRRNRPALRARPATERTIVAILAICATIAVFTTIGIVLSLLFETLRFFERVSILEFLFGLRWSPQEALRADQVGSSGAFGAIPVFAGTLLITAIAMFVAGPIGLFSAVYLSEYAGPTIRAWVKPILEVLAGIPTVVYGFFAALVVAPAVRNAGTALGLDVASESALAAGLVMGVMIIPYVSSLSDDVINAVPHALRDGSYALGATRSETIRRVVIPAAQPGIVGALLLGVSRAVGETMIVVLAAG